MASKIRYLVTKIIRSELQNKTTFMYRNDQYQFKLIFKEGSQNANAISRSAVIAHTQPVTFS
jgi:hypothetical protein